MDATAFFIHLAIHRAGAACVLHTHMPRATALCCVESFELAMCHQNSLRFAGDVAYDPTFNGLVLDNAEGERLVKVMDGKRVLMHKHHGVIVSGASVAEAFDDLYYLERAAEVQILAMSTGSPLSIIGDDVARRFRRGHGIGRRQGALGAVALRRAHARTRQRPASAHLHRLIAQIRLFVIVTKFKSVSSSRRDGERRRLRRVRPRARRARDAWTSPRSTARSMTSPRPSKPSRRCASRRPSSQLEPTNFVEATRGD